jgi:hypothetical protein
MKTRAAIIGLMGGVLIAPLAIFLAIVSGGAGHGHYISAKLWFPFTMASTYLFESIAAPFIALAIAQYPIYGWLVGRATEHVPARRILWVVGSCHVALATLLLLRPSMSFE